MLLSNKTSQLCPTPSAEHQEAGDASQLLQTKAHTLTVAYQALFPGRCKKPTLHVDVVVPLKPTRNPAGFRETWIEP